MGIMGIRTSSIQVLKQEETFIIPFTLAITCDSVFTFICGDDFHLSQVRRRVICLAPPPMIVAVKKILVLACLYCLWFKSADKLLPTLYS